VFIPLRPLEIRLSSPSEAAKQSTTGGLTLSLSGGKKNQF
jgi:hypothetical protein